MARASECFSDEIYNEILRAFKFLLVLVMLDVFDLWAWASGEEALGANQGRTLKTAWAFDLGVSGLLHDRIFQRISSFLRGHLTPCVSQNSISILLDR